VLMGMVADEFINVMSRLRDLFIQGANDLIYAGEDQIEALEAAGFTELAEKFKRMSTVSGAYDWTRENL